jgi:hypothetical protein
MLVGWVTGAVAAPTIDEPVRAGASSPADAALVVGIEDYAFLPDVPFARRDAAAVADLLVHTRGVPPDHVVRLDGGSLEQLRAGLDRARAALGPGGTLWVYFAGHGAADPRTGGLVLVGDDAKADATVFSDRAWPLDALTGSLPAGSVVLLDTCWAGAARAGGAPLLPGARFAVPAALVPPREVTVWTAAAPAEVATTYAGHGAFTYFAVGALRGWADGEGSGTADGAVDLDEARAWVVRAMAAAGVTGQTPSSTGPSPRALTRGTLEPAPPLHVFAPEAAVLAPLGGLGVPDGVAGVVFGAEGLGWTPPFRPLGGGRYADAEDHTVSFETLAATLRGDVAGEEALRAYRRRTAPVAVGAGAAFLGGLFGGIATPVAWSQYAKAVNRGLSCSDPGALDYLCIDEGRALGWAVALSGVTAVTVGGGVGLALGATPRARRAQAELIDVVEERLAP